LRDAAFRGAAFLRAGAALRALLRATFFAAPLRAAFLLRPLRDADRRAFFFAMLDSPSLGVHGRPSER
jgi:hypothetical protein